MDSSPLTRRSTPRRTPGMLAAVAAAAAAAVMAATAAHAQGQALYPTGREALLSPTEIAAAPAPPGVACGQRLPGTNHTLDCGTGGGSGVPVGAVVLVPVAGGGGGGDGCPPTTLLFLHGQSSAPLVDYLPLLTGLARLPAVSGVRMVMPLAPLHPFVRVTAANGSESGAYAWYNLYVPPPAGVAATAAAANDSERVAVARAYPWAVDSLGLALSTTRLIRTVLAAEAAAGRRVVVVGHSLGAGMSLHLAAVLGGGGAPAQLGNFLAVSGLLPLADLHASGVMKTAGARPVVVLHGEADVTIPAASSRLSAAVWTAGGGQARYRGVPGAGHGDVLVTPAMAEEVTAVLAGGGASA